MAFFKIWCIDIKFDVQNMQNICKIYLKNKFQQETKGDKKIQPSELF